MSTQEIDGLLAQVALGNRSAFSELYDRTSAKLFGVCLRVLKNRTEAEEALQEAFVKIWHGASKYSSGTYSPISWLVAIARNNAIDRLRGRKAPTVELDDATMVADPNPGPEASLLASDMRRQIEDCLGELETDKAGAVRGAYLEGFSYAELAEQFDVPLNTMRTWLRRSLQRLRTCMNGADASGESAGGV